MTRTCVWAICALCQALLSWISVPCCLLLYIAGSSPTKEGAPSAAGAAPSATPAAAAPGAEAEIPAMTPEEEAAMKEKVERLSGHMFAVM
jgi:hypothetical protein